MWGVHLCRQRLRTDIGIKKSLMDLNFIQSFLFKVSKNSSRGNQNHLTRYELKKQLECVWLITILCMYVCSTYYILLLLFLLLLNECGLIRNFFISTWWLHRTMERHNLTAIKFVGIKAVFPQWHLLNYFVAYFSISIVSNTHNYYEYLKQRRSMESSINMFTLVLTLIWAENKTQKYYVNY